MTKLLEIGGKDFTEYISEGGYEVTRNDLDSDKSSRALNGTLRRSRITVKMTLKITCRPLDEQEVKIVLSAIYPQKIAISYHEPRTGAPVSTTAYTSTVPASLRYVGGKWHGIAFSLIEV